MRYAPRLLVMVLSQFERRPKRREEQIVNLERAFEVIGHKPRAQKCAASIGLDDERMSF